MNAPRAVIRIDNRLLAEEFAEKVEVIQYLSGRKKRQLQRVEKTGPRFGRLKSF